MQSLQRLPWALFPLPTASPRTQRKHPASRASLRILPLRTQRPPRTQLPQLFFTARHLSRRTRLRQLAPQLHRTAFDPPHRLHPTSPRPLPSAQIQSWARASPPAIWLTACTNISSSSCPPRPTPPPHTCTTPAASAHPLEAASTAPLPPPAHRRPTSPLPHTQAHGIILTISPRTPPTLLARPAFSSATSSTVMPPTS